MAKLKGLGKGLDALFAASNVQMASIITAEANSSLKHDIAVAPEITNANDVSIHYIALNAIRASKYQPRKSFDKEALQELSDSILHNGVIQPIIVRKIVANDIGDDYQYEIIAGERRWRASKLAGLQCIPAIVREFSDTDALAIALIENIQRRDLTIIEEAKCFKRLLDEFDLTHDAISKMTGRSRSSITNILRLLNLHPAVQDMLTNNELTMGHARALLPLPTEMQLALAKEVIANNYTTSKVEAKVTNILHANANCSNDTGNDGIEIIKTTNCQTNDSNISQLETTIANKLGMAVNIKHNRNGKGKLIISYSSLDELLNVF